MAGDQAGARGRIWPYGFILLSLTGFQLGAALARPLFPLIGAPGTSALRLGLAALMMAVVVRPWRVKLGGRTLRLILAYGVALAGLNLFFYMAIRTIPLGLTVAIEFAGPLALSVATSHRRIDLVWASLAAGGIALLLPVTRFGAGLDPIGLAFAFLSATCWVCYIVLGQKVGSTVPTAAAASYGVLVAALVVLPVGLVDTGGGLFRLDILPLAFAVAVVSGSLPYLLEMAALKHISAGVFGILMSLEPALGALFGYLILGQHLTALQGFAILAVMTASAGVTLTQRPVPVPQ